MSETLEYKCTSEFEDQLGLLKMLCHAGVMKFGYHGIEHESGRHLAHVHFLNGYSAKVRAASQQDLLKAITKKADSIIAES